MATILFWILVAAITFFLLVVAGVMWLMWKSHDAHQALEEEYGDTF